MLPYPPHSPLRTRLTGPLFAIQGFKVPEPLRKYLPGAPEFIPFTKELPKTSTSQKPLVTGMTKKKDA